MNKASEYRSNAGKCRELASKTQFSADRAMLLKMAEQWEQLARDRADLIDRHPELARDGDHGGGRTGGGKPPKR